MDTESTRGKLASTPLPSRLQPLETSSPFCPAQQKKKKTLISPSNGISQTPRARRSVCCRVGVRNTARRIVSGRGRYLMGGGERAELVVNGERGSESAGLGLLGWCWYVGISSTTQSQWQMAICARCIFGTLTRHFSRHTSARQRGGSSVVSQEPALALGRKCRSWLDGLPATYHLVIALEMRTADAGRAWGLCVSYTA